MENSILPLKPDSQLNYNQHNPIIVDTIKEEIEDDVVELEELLGFNKNGSVSVSATIEENDLMGKPFELLHEMGTPPFLKKIYEMVENKESDEIISWGENGVSFIVWDYHKFSIDLLPKYFKHSNFSSFIRQLNTYGFRKVHFDRWEFANVDFQRGKKQLLKSIKRKYHGGNNNLRLNSQTGSEIEKLKLEHEALKAEIHDLKQQQLSSNQSLATMEDRIKSLEWKQKDFLLFIAKAMKSSSLFQQLLQNYREKKAIENGQVFKRRRLESVENPDNSNFKELNQNSSYCPRDDRGGIQDEVNPCFGSSPGCLGPQSVHEQSSSLTSETSSSELSSGSYIMWEKLMQDDVICEQDDEKAFNDGQNNFVHELEGLIA